MQDVQYCALHTGLLSAVLATLQSQAIGRIIVIALAAMFVVARRTEQDLEEANIARLVRCLGVWD